MPLDWAINIRLVFGRVDKRDGSEVWFAQYEGDVSIGNPSMWYQLNLSV